jgi:hypothetical protein
MPSPHAQREAFGPPDVKIQHRSFRSDAKGTCFKSDNPKTRCWRSRHAVDTLILAVLTKQAGQWRFKALENSR